MRGGFRLSERLFPEPLLRTVEDGAANVAPALLIAGRVKELRLAVELKEIDVRIIDALPFARREYRIARRFFPRAQIFRANRGRLISTGNGAQINHVIVVADAPYDGARAVRISVRPGVIEIGNLFPMNEILRARELKAESDRLVRFVRHEIPVPVPAYGRIEQMLVLRLKRGRLFPRFEIGRREAHDIAEPRFSLRLLRRVDAQNVAVGAALDICARKGAARAELGDDRLIGQIKDAQFKLLRFVRRRRRPNRAERERPPLPDERRRFHNAIAAVKDRNGIFNKPRLRAAKNAGGA